LAAEISIPLGIRIKTASRFSVDLSMVSHIVYKKMKKNKRGLLMLRGIGISSWNSVSKFRGYTFVDRKKIRADIINVEIQRVSKI